MKGTCATSWLHCQPPSAVHCGKVHTLQHDPQGNLLQRLNCKHTWLYDILGGKQVTVSSSLTCKGFTSHTFEHHSPK